MKTLSTLLALSSLVAACGASTPATRPTRAGVTTTDASRARPASPRPDSCGMCNGTREYCWREVPVQPPPGWYEQGGSPLQNARERCDPRCCPAR